MTAGKESAQAALFARFGVPRKLPPDEVDPDGTEVVRVYGVPTLEAARAFVDAETRGPWRNPARVELREGHGWVVVVDLRARVQSIRRAHPLPRIRG